MRETAVLLAVIAVALDGWLSYHALRRGAREVGVLARWLLDRGSSHGEAMLLTVVIRWGALAATVGLPLEVQTWFAGLIAGLSITAAIVAWHMAR